MACKTSALVCPLHANVCLLDQSDRTVLRRTDRKANPPRRPSLDARTGTSHPRLHQNRKPQSKAVPMDQVSRQYPRFNQALLPRDTQNRRQSGQNHQNFGIRTLAYFSIPFALAIFVSKRRDVQFGWIFWAFAVFIMACGLTHILSIYTLWVPVYGIEGLVKAVTAVASVATAVMLWPSLPKLLAIPSPFQLQQAQAALQQEETQRRGAEAMLQQFQQI